MALNYFINKKAVTYVVSLTGTIATDDVAILQKCVAELLESSPKYLILNLGAVTQIQKDMLRPFTIFQQTIRDSSKLFVCNASADLLKTLRNDGVVRESELQPDLMQALKVILMQESK